PLYVNPFKPHPLKKVHTTNEQTEPCHTDYKQISFCQPPINQDDQEVGSFSPTRSNTSFTKVENLQPIISSTPSNTPVNTMKIPNNTKTARINVIAPLCESIQTSPPLKTYRRLQESNLPLRPKRTTISI